MKKFLALLLAAMMLLATASFAMAETYTITVNNSATGYTYNAYQIFTGDLNGTTLSNIQWGNGITKDGQEAAYALYNLEGDNKTAAKVAEALKNDTGTDAEKANRFAKTIAGYVSTVADTATAPDATANAYLLDNLNAGYYLVVNTAGSDVLSKYIMAVVADTEVTPKVGTVTFDKKVKDINDSTDTTESNWQDSADHDVGDDVPFKLEGGLPETYDEFIRFSYVFTDVLSDGLSFNQDVEVYVVNGTTETKVDEVDYTVSALTTVEGGKQFTVSFDSLKEYKTAEKDEQGNVVLENNEPVMVTKGGVHNNGAVIELTATSKIVVKYTAKLNENAVIGPVGNPNAAKLTYATNPYWNGEGEESKKDTPWDNVIVFTYKLKIYKYTTGENGAKVPLDGAQFTLYKLDKTTGEYEVVAVMTENTSTETADSVEWTAGTVFTHARLDDGQYKISETVTPAGYNTAADILFTVTANHEISVQGNAAPKLNSITAPSPITVISTTTSEGEGAVTTYTGEMSTQIVNNVGATLPSTGGIGTTLFYLFGSIMAAGSALILVVRRRAEAEEE